MFPHLPATIVPSTAGAGACGCHLQDRGCWGQTASRSTAQTQPGQCKRGRGPFVDLLPICIPATAPRAAGSPATRGKGRALWHWDSARTCPSTFSARKQVAFFPAKSQPCPKHLLETPHPSKEGRVFGRAAILRQPQPPSTPPDTDLVHSFMRYVSPCHVPRGCCSVAGEGTGMRSDRPCWLAPLLPAHPPLPALSPRISTALLMSLGCRASHAGVLPGGDKVLRCQTDR